MIKTQKQVAPIIYQDKSLMSISSGWVKFVDLLNLQISPCNSVEIIIGLFVVCISYVLRVGRKRKNKIIVI